jgi:hypothetical protein
LRGEDEEWIRQLEAVALDRDLPLLHRFEQRRLGLRRSAVDFIREHDVGEDGAGAQRKRAVPRIQHVSAGDVGGQQIRRELDAADRGSQGRREGFDERRLGDTGDPFEQHVPAREQRDEHHVHLRRVADVNAAHLVAHVEHPLPRRLDFIHLQGVGHFWPPPASSIADNSFSTRWRVSSTSSGVTLRDWEAST